MEAEEADDRMEETPPPSEEEGEGVMSEDEHDSSEESEEDDDPEEARRIAEGFIVDDSRERHHKHKKHRRRKKHRKHREGGDEDVGELDEDDLDLLEQNTGRRFDRPDAPRKLIRKGGHAADDADQEAAVPTLEGLFGQEAVRRFDQDEDDMADFIEEDEDDLGAQPRERDRAAQSAARPQRSGFSRAAAGLSQEAWEEIQAIFGNGTDYDWAMEADDDISKADMKLEDIYEPSQIAERMMTQADDEMRALDKPERMQLATASLTTLRTDQSVEELLAPIIAEEDLDAATEWVAPRISANLSTSFLVNFEGGIEHPLRVAFLGAVRAALQQICTFLLEPPFVWLHRRDYFVHFDPTNLNPQLQHFDLLGRSHLWTIQTLGIKYRAFIDRRAGLRSMWDSLQEQPNQTFEDAFAALESAEEVSDLTEWVNMTYSSQIQRLKEVQLEEDGIAPNALKKTSRETRYSRIRSSPVYHLAQMFGSPPSAVGQDFAQGARTHFVEDPNESPVELAHIFVDAASPHSATREAALESARFAIVHELAGLAPLRKAIRRLFRDKALITVRPTEQGMSKIDTLHPYYTFKYMTAKPIRSDFRQSSSFVYMLDAERNGDITIAITLPEKEKDDLLADLSRVYLSDYTSQNAQLWNDLRRDILQTTVDKHLMPFGAKWLRENLLEEVSDFVARRCAEELGKKVDVAPYRARSLSEGEIPSVVAISHGHGDPKKDSVWVVFVDDSGRVREHFNVDNLRPTNVRNPDGDEYRERLSDLLVRRHPQVVVLGGFTPTTHRLHQDILSIVQDAIPKVAKDIRDDQDEDGAPLYATDEAARNAATIETIFVNDEVARIYQHSARAQAEFSELPTVGRYCVAMARYVQSPVNEYAALGKDILALTFDQAQKFINESLLKTYLERAIVNSVNTCGVDINRAVREPYYASILPYVAGLGPRKAQRMIERINQTGGVLPSRAALVTREITGRTVFMNCAAFLRIDHDELPKKLLNTAGEDAPDVLDSTRIHPEDYDIARKMAADAEELDEEDLADLTHPSQVVSRLLEDDPKKLDELSLDDFAVELQRLLGTPKRLTLYLIRDELKLPFKEQRRALTSLDAPQIFSQLTGETRQTLELGLIVPAMITRLIGDKKILVRLDSGVEGTIDSGFFDINPELPHHQTYQIGSTIQAVVNQISMPDFAVQLDSRQSSVSQGDASYRSVARDPFWDENEEQIDISRAEAHQKKKANRSYRTIQHPYFHNYNSRQAEEFLSHQAPGECVVRPSGRGPDHLAVTWKVASDLYQHLDVVELDKPSEFELGRKLKIGGKFDYSDIDELVVSHIKAMARKIEEMVHHDKFKGGEEDTVKFLQNQQRANPNQSTYAFALDRRNPGQFKLMYLTNKSTMPKAWPVHVTPSCFILQETECPDVMSLCNAFKTQYVTALSNRSVQQGGRTPYGAAANAGQWNYGAQPPYGMQNGYAAYGQAPAGMGMYGGYGSGYR